MKIVVVGSLNLDFVVQADRFPQKGETLMGTGSTMSFGGKGANQAVCAAKLGAEVSMIGCLGKDANGDIMLENMKKYGIDTNGIERTDTASGIAQITIAENDNTIIIVSGANDQVSKEQIDRCKNQILDADLVMLQLEIPLDTVAYVIELCHKHQVKTILNPAPAVELGMDIIDRVTYLTPNEIEVEQIFKDKLENVLPLYPNKMIVTAGSRGVYYHDGKALRNIQPKPVNVVDTTGAGDAFNGAFAVAVTAGKNIDEAIRFGNSIAGYAIGKLGAQTSMPELHDIEEWNGGEK